MLASVPTYDCHTAMFTTRMSSDELAAKLWARVVKQPTGCWEWQGARSRGYGQIGVPRERRVVYTHRLAYELANGPIPDGLLVCHTCDNPPCCNPAHLWVGSHVDNAVDMVGKARTNNRAGMRHHNAKLTYEQVAEIRSRYVPGTDKRLGTGASAVELAEEFGITRLYVRILSYGEWRVAA